MKVAVIGDLLLDVERVGTVRAHPADVWPVVDERAVRHVAGGAGNAAANVASLGAEVQVFGVVGDDEDGARLRSLLCGQPTVCAGRITPRKERVIADGRTLMRIDREDAREIPWDDPDPVLGSGDWATADAVLASDYRKGAWIEARARTVVTRARGPVVADVRSDPRWWRGVAVYCPTWEEACRALGTIDPIPALKALLPGSTLALTRGAGGVVWTDGGPIREIPAADARVLDPVGAGDTFAAAVAVALAEGCSLEASLARAVDAAAVAVARLGLAAVARAELP